MYGASEEIIDIVEQLYEAHKVRDHFKTNQLLKNLEIFDHPYARYCHYLIYREVSDLGELNDLMLAEFVDEKFPPAIVRSAALKLKECDDLNQFPELLADLKQVASSGHVVAKQILCAYELVNSSFVRMPGLFLKMCKLHIFKRKIDKNLEISNQNSWY